MPGWVRKPGAALRATILPEIGLGTSRTESTLRFVDDLVDLGIGLAEYPNRVPCGLEIAFRGLLIRGRLIDVFLGAAARLQKPGGARQRPLLQFQHARGREQRRFSLQQVRTIDGEEDVAGLDVVTDVEIGLENLPRILRKYLDQQILVKVNGADRGFEKRKITRSHRAYLERTRLLFG